MDTVLVPVHKAGHPFIIIFALIALGLGFVAAPLGWIGWILTAWCVYFFRDPERYIPDQEGLIVATGDGVVSMIEKVAPPPELDMGTEELTRISIFLNVFNVHVNRTPVAGTVSKIHYHSGKFFNASLDKASIHNERNSAVITTKEGKDIIFVQIAGLVARRILCFIEEGQEMQTGERYGLIRFGSRCDIYLPEGVNPLVAIGQKTLGGETILADLNSSAPATTATCR